MMSLGRQGKDGCSNTEESNDVCQITPDRDVRHIADGKRVGRPPYDYTVEDGFLQQIPSEYVRAQNFICEVRKGREKHATAAYFEIPESAIQSILAWAEANYHIPFDNDQGRLERAKVDAGEKELPPLDARNERCVPSAEMPTE